MALPGPYQREAKELVEAFLEEGCLSESAAEQAVALLEEERYIDSLETVLRNL